jgi:folate-binding protein YgfZ
MRYKNCIPEGIKEIEANATLPMEINLDLLGGISFEKGCFIGQEVNARVKYKGLVKKKYVPVHFKNENFSFSNFDKIDNKIYLKSQDIGEVIALSLNQEDDIWYGIGKIKLSQLYLFEENNKLECDFFGSKIKINFPNYMLPLPRKM